MNARVWSNVSVWTLLVANLFPLVGVFLWGWDIYTLMVLYWSESAIVGFFGILGILLEAGIFSLFLVPFFCVHFGMFMTVHFILLNGFFGPPWARTLHFTAVLSKLIFQDGLWKPMALLFVSHGVAFYLHTFRRWWQRAPLQVPPEELAKVRSPLARFLLLRLANNLTGASQAGDLMTAPYKRVVVMHGTLLFGGFLVLALHAQQAGFALMIALKVAADLHGLVKVHRLSDGSLVAEPSAAENKATE